LQLIIGFGVSLLVFTLKTLGVKFLSEVEPLLIGLVAVALIQIFGHYKKTKELA
jgi:hypothetical protein